MDGRSFIVILLATVSCYPGAHEPPKPGALGLNAGAPVKKKPKEVGRLRMAECRYRQTTFELFGAKTPEAEMALNRKGPADIEPRIFWRDSYDAITACETGVDAQYDERVGAVSRGLVTMEAGG